MAAKRGAARARGTSKGTAGQRRGPRAAASSRRASVSPRDLDRVIHSRMRLAIVSALAVNERMSFRELRDAVGTTDGNLSVHARKLEEVGYVSCKKSFSGRVPHTEYELTRPGRRALEAYLAHMESLIRAARG